MQVPIRQVFRMPEGFQNHQLLIQYPQVAPLCWHHVNRTFKRGTSQCLRGEFFIHPDEHMYQGGFRHIVYRFSLLIPTWWEDSFWLGWNVTLLSSKVDADAVALACAAQACRDGRRRVGCRISFEFGGWLWRNDEGVLFGWRARVLAPGIWWKGLLRYNKVWIRYTEVIPYYLPLLLQSHLWVI